MNQSLVLAAAGIYGRFGDKRLFGLEFRLVTGEEDKRGGLFASLVVFYGRPQPIEECHHESQAS